MLPIVRLNRLESTEQGTISVIRIGVEVFCFSIAPQDLENQQNISCIPPGMYRCRRHISAKYNTFEITNVPGRTKVLFHAGNTINDTEGCECLGSEVGKLKGNRAVLNSGDTFKRFMEALGTAKDAEFWLIVEENY